MRGGRLRHRVVIQQPRSGVDAYGQPVVTWESVAQVSAAIEPLNGREFFTAQQVNAETTTRIRIRYRAGLTAKMRIFFAPDTDNLVPWSEQLENWSDAGSSSGVVTGTNVAAGPAGTTIADQLTDNSASVAEAITSNELYPLDAETWTASAYFLADAVSKATRFVALRLWFSGGTATYMDARLDTKIGILQPILNGTGTIISYSSEYVSGGAGYWYVSITGKNNSTGNNVVRPWIYPAIGVAGGGEDMSAISVSATGSTVVAGVMLQRSATLATYQKTERVEDIGRVYDITSIIHPREINQEIILMCKEGVNEGG